MDKRTQVELLAENALLARKLRSNLLALPVTFSGHRWEYADQCRRMEVEAIDDFEGLLAEMISDANDGGTGEIGAAA